jgi:F-type H+-transporting ATPase subunit delta
VASQKQTVTGVPGRYATALFELAQEEDAIDAVAQGLDRFQAMLDQSDDLRRLVTSPVFAAEQQIAALREVLPTAAIDGLAEKFILLLARNRRLSGVQAMILAFRRLLAAARGEVTAEVTSAEQLSEAQLATITAELKAVIGREVAVAVRQDEAILGGLIVKVGSRMVDNSLRTKLQNLKVAMKGTG